MIYIRKATIKVIAVTGFYFLLQKRSKRLHCLLVCLDCFSFPGYSWSWNFVNMVLESPGKVLEF